MFVGGFGNLTLDGDHVDICYRTPETWPNLTPLGSIRFFSFEFGDPVAGPQMQIGMNVPNEEVLDWKHVIDPIHHHGSDQFRVISGGEWTLARRKMTAGTTSFQEAGWVYQEHPGTDEPAWTALMMADRRGGQSTLRFARVESDIFKGTEYDAPEDDAPYPHPAGHKGLAAIATTLGPCDRGYIFVESDELRAKQVITGVLGDAEAGPAVHVFYGEPGATLIPTCSYATEIVFIVPAGGCAIAGTDYSAGDIRVQAAGAAFDVVASADGVELVMLVADRRAAIGVPGGERLAWMDEPARLAAMLEPVPGGTWRKRAPRRVPQNA